MDQQQIFQLLKNEYLTGNKDFMRILEIDKLGKKLFGCSTVHLHVKLIKLYAYGLLEQKQAKYCNRMVTWYRIKPKIALNGIKTVVSPLSKDISMEDYRKLT
jgi:hypothetical protein